METKAMDQNMELPPEYSRWWLATAIPMANIRGLDVDYWLPQLFSSTEFTEEVKQDIKGYWNVSGEEECKTIIRELLHGEYIGTVWQSRFRTRQCRSEHQWHSIVNREENELIKGELRFVDTVYKQAGPAGFLAWDLSRGSYLLRQAFYLGWVSDQELIFLLNQYAFRVQDNFVNWRQYINSFVFGRNVNSYLNEEDSTTTSIDRLLTDGFALNYRNYFHYLDEDFSRGVYDIPWDVRLPFISGPDSLLSPEPTEN